MQRKISILLVLIISIACSGCSINKSQPQINNNVSSTNNLVSTINTSKGHFPTNGWETSTPEEQGVDSEKLCKMIKYIRENNKDIHNIVIIKNGYLIMQADFYPNNKDTKHVLYSCTKSITSVLLGIAINEGYIKSTDEKVLSYFKDMQIDNVDSKKQSLTIEHLLTMTTGFDWNEDGSYGSDTDSDTQMWRSNNQLKYVLDRPMKEEPGKTFYYCTGASHILSGIIQKATGKNVFAYAQEKLFKPLGIKDVYWQSDSSGINIGGSGIYMTPLDMAKFGYLYLRKGNWEGHQIVPEKWVEESTKKRIETQNGLAGRYGYGYQWWMNSFGGYSARGYGGQYIFGLPELDMVVVFTSALRGSDFFVPENLVETFIIPAAKSGGVGKSSPNNLLKTILEEIARPPKP